MQQLTDAVVTLTAELQTLKGATVLLPHQQGQGDDAKTPKSHAAENLETETDIQIETQVRGITADVVIVDELETQIEFANGAAIAYTPETDYTDQPTTNVIDITAQPMDMSAANIALNEINQQIGDGGIAIRTLLQQHNAITLGQIDPSKYGEFVAEARGLIAVQQA